MKAQDLKNSVLKLAIQGKLVERNPNDEPASVLLEKIKAEKEQLIKEKKIKKEKPLPEISEEDKPFEIPDSWEWVRLVDILDVRDGTHDTPKYQDVGIPLVTSKNLKDGELDFENIKFISQLDHEKISQRSCVENGDILFAMIGSIGNPVVVKKDREFSIKNVALFKTLPQNKIDIEYLFYYLIIEQERMKNIASGGVQSFVSLSFLRAYIIPIPPLEEQKRIVAKIEEVLEKIEEYDNAEKELTQLEKAFPQDMKKSILQYAIQGKLVEQNPNDEPASVLLEKIKAEKEQLIKEKKIKKEKPLPEISEEEKLFEIPDTWEWIRLGQIINISSGKNLTAKNMNQSGGIPVFGGNGITGYHDKYNVDKSTLVIGRVGFYCGSVHITPQYAWVTDNAFITTFSETNININYLKLLITVLELRKKSSSTAQPVISGKTVYPIPIALPPLEEQKRIVESVEKLSNYLDKLQNRIDNEKLINKMIQAKSIEEDKRELVNN